MISSIEFDGQQRFNDIATSLLSVGSSAARVPIYGKVQRVLGGVVKAAVPNAVLGELCVLINEDESEVLSEVVAFEEDGALLTPYNNLRGISLSTRVLATGGTHRIGVGPELLGRVVDGFGRLVDDDSGPAPIFTTYYPVIANPPDPMTRKKIKLQLGLGVRALDTLLSCGEGQRMGVFAAAGVGKSTLLGMIVQHADADIVVIGLIGERGREVREFIDDELGEGGLKKSVVVVATSDRPAIERAKAAHVATAIAEYFRDQGKRVLLLMDSVTRFARAQREIGLAAGEPPTRRGFPSSVFAELPKLLERAGNNNLGSITAIYTVLVEGDDVTEPIADETRSILDGHIILSRKLAAENHYPCIDVLDSVSRVMGKIVSEEHATNAARLRELLAKYAEVELLLRVGEYQAGTDELADEAIARIDDIKSFLKQRVNEPVSHEESLSHLFSLFGEGV